MKTYQSMLALALLGAGSAVHASLPMMYEEVLAQEEEKLILAYPIAGIENSLWFDYRIDVTEAQKELVSDLRDASDVEDRREAWEEYARELKHERFDYIEDMAERGYRMGEVTVIPNS
ncbi:hypothetical protein WAB17_09225 [Parerythrobacter aurantius]|uniref:hypothetical protein n=1 Tax=Parerythrobacter aurantius TaxID=3127706 RepID=UPI0032569233